MGSVPSALRGIVRQPRVAFFICLTLAVAISATTVIFTFVNALVLEPLPMAEPSRVVLVFSTSDHRDITRGGTSLPDFLDWQSRATSFAAMAAAETTTRASFETGTGPVPVRLRRVTASFARAWGLAPGLGRRARSDLIEPNRWL